MSLKENAWTREVRFIKEDNLLYEFVIEKKIRKWTKIANALSENLGVQPRSGKQCRERWHNHLDPDITKDVWSKEEKRQIFELQKKFGNRWSKISKYIPGRTDNSVKNCFYSVIRKNVRKYNKRKPETEKLKGPIKSLLRNPEIKELLFNPKLKLPSNCLKPTTVKKPLESIEIVCPEVTVPAFQTISVPITPSTCTSIYSPHYTQFFNFSDNLGCQDTSSCPMSPLSNLSFLSYGQNAPCNSTLFAGYPGNVFFFNPYDAN
ncbi:hypothetical protein SteCoe_1308 [Stentor coeruleus]|uniref:Myb-like DNA-binding domain containing protein n=1 Tax=Stentor coeruleus TaxID=5963 RepID=A0A1R2D2E9_9CILI|nr:hypothetical protein SteCoe_1308 [Stentor coeruleus]